MNQPKFPVFLGSTSIYRKQLLEKLGIPFTVVQPTCDEELIKTELLKNQFNKSNWAEQLAYAKARSIDQKGLVITSDQTVLFDNEILGKPKTFERAFSQLQKMQGEIHHLITAVVIRCDDQYTHHVQVDQMQMRQLTDSEIKNYLLTDQPYDAAGSYKIESSGITLFASIHCDDFTGIQGLPMIWVSQKLKEYDYEFYCKN
jgi:septum formation protein